VFVQRPHQVRVPVCQPAGHSQAPTLPMMGKEGHELTVSILPAMCPPAPSTARLPRSVLVALGAALLFAVDLAAQTPAGLRIVVIESEGAVNVARATGSAGQDSA
jgi:hypothetical protein